MSNFDDIIKKIRASKAIIEENINKDKPDNSMEVPSSTLIKELVDWDTDLDRVTRTVSTSSIGSFFNADHNFKEKKPDAASSEEDSLEDSADISLKNKHY